MLRVHNECAELLFSVRCNRMIVGILRGAFSWDLAHLRLLWGRVGATRTAHIATFWPISAAKSFNLPDDLRPNRCLHRCNL
jgi:hypothetical protein